jgi:hypothetical protein
MGEKKSAGNKLKSPTPSCSTSNTSLLLIRHSRMLLSGIQNNTGFRLKDCRNDVFDWLFM